MDLLGTKTPAPAPATGDIIDGSDATFMADVIEMSMKVPVIVDFWATWCGPCLKELPEVAELIEAYAEADRADDLRVLCVSIDEAGDDPGKVAKEVLTFLDRNDLDLRSPPMAEVALDSDGAMARAFGVRAIPSALLVGPDGNVKAVITGFDPDFRRKMSNQIDQLLKELPEADNAR